jgi:hypothetical protein
MNLFNDSFRSYRKDKTMTTTSSLSTRHFWLRWLPTFLGFPIGGLFTSLSVGPIHTPLEALLGGLLAGAVIGLAQWLGLRSIHRVSPFWIVATSLGLGAGLALSVTLLGTETQTAPLLARGVVTGFFVGAAQALVLRNLPNPVTWTLALTLLWPVAWFITSLVIRQNLASDYAVFGASGAVVFTVLSGFVLGLRRS